MNQFKLALIAVPFIVASCASQAPQPQDVEPRVSPEQQQRAQAAAHAEPVQLALKRKIAIGRISNETTYGKSLLRSGRDELGSKVTDMFQQALINSGNYLVFERPDIERLQNEATLTEQSQNLVGVDTLIIGALTEFGRDVTGETGFLSSSKKQQATATIDLRLVDVSTGQAFTSVSGSGSSSTETARTMGFGSVAGYDGSLNDRAIGAAVNAAVEKLTLMMLQKPWTADIIAIEDEQVFISGGRSQGVKPGMVFDVVTRGKKVKSQTTGSLITLPGEKIAELKVNAMFGQSELDQGAVATVTSGSIGGYSLADIQVQEIQQ